jgi:hypothetical protein
MVAASFRVSQVFRKKNDIPLGDAGGFGSPQGDAKPVKLTNISNLL